MYIHNLTHGFLLQGANMATVTGLAIHACLSVPPAFALCLARLASFHWSSHLDFYIVLA